MQYYSQCNWLPPAILTPEQALSLSTHCHSMKTTLLAAAGQLNVSLESRAKQSHRRKSVQLFSRADVWPHLFYKEILCAYQCSWRPLTSQARSAKQPLPEPPFNAPPLTQADLLLVQVLSPKNQLLTSAQFQRS